MFYKKFKIFLTVAILFFTLVAACVFFCCILLQQESFQRYIISKLSTAAGYNIDAVRIKIKYKKGIELEFCDLTVEPYSNSYKLSVHETNIFFNIKELLRGNIFPANVLLSQPVLTLAGKNNLCFRKPDTGFVLKKNLLNSLLKIGSVYISDGRVLIEKEKLKLSELICDLDRLENEPDKFNLDISGEVEFENEKSPFSVKGSVGVEIKGRDKLFCDIRFLSDDLPLTWMSKKPFFQVKKGYADVDIRIFTENSGHVKFDGNISSKGLCFWYKTKKAAKLFDLPKLSADFKADYFNKTLQISPIKLMTPDYLLNADFTFSQNKTSYIDLDITSSFMPFMSFKEIFPTPLVPRWIGEKLFPVFFDGKVRVDLFSLKGTFDQLRSLYLPKNKNNLILKLTLKDMTGLKGGENLPFTGTCGKICIQSGALAVTDAKGVFGSSVVKDGSYYVDKLYSQKRLHSFFIDGSFELGDITKQGKIDFVPSVIKDELQKFTFLSGTLDAKIRLDYKKGWKFPELKESNFILRNIHARHKDLLLPLSLNNAEIKVDNNRKCTINGKGKWGWSDFDVSGTGVNLWEEGKAEVSFHAQINEISKLINDRPNSGIDLSGLITGRVLLARKNGHLSFKGKIDLEGLTIDPGSFFTDHFNAGDEVLFDVDIVPGRKVNFNDIGCAIGDSSIKVSGFLDLNSSFLSLLLDAKPIRLEDIGFMFRKNKTNAKGTLFCSAKLETSLPGLSDISINGEVKGQNISFPSEFIFSNITDCCFNIKFSEKDVLISSLSFVSNRSSFFVKGHLSGWDGLKGKLDVRADFFDISDLTFKKSFQKSSKSSRFIKNSNIKLDIRAKKGRWKKIEHGALFAESVFKSGNFYINRCDVQLEKGQVQLTGHVETGKKPDILFFSNINLTGYPVQNIFESLDIKDRIVGGNLIAKGFIAGEGKDVKDFICDLSGNFDLIVEGGMIKKSNIIFDILNFLSLKKIIDKSKFDFSKDGFNFEKIVGSIAIENGVLQIDKVIMTSSVFNAAGKGEIDLVEKMEDLDLGVAPLGTIDSLINKIPVVGFVLTGKDKSFVTYYIKIKGPISKPKIVYVPFKHWPSGMIGFIKRTLKTPQRLFKEIYEMQDKLF